MGNPNGLGVGSGPVELQWAIFNARVYGPEVAAVSPYALLAIRAAEQAAVLEEAQTVVEAAGTNINNEASTPKSEFSL